MTDNEHDDRWLDQLLEQPPVLVERKFTETLVRRLRTKARQRRRIFLLAGCFWLLVAVIVSPRQSIILLAQRLTEVVMQSGGLLDLVVGVDSSGLLSQPGLLAVLAVFLSSAYALVSLQIRGR